MIKKSLLLLSALFMGTIMGHAASLASDNATNSAYDDGWAAGDNGGTGFGAWTNFNLSGGGPGGFAGNYVGQTGWNEGVAPPPRSFGIFSGGNVAAFASVDRPFTGSLTNGQGFSVELGNTANVTGQIGLNLLSGTTPVFTLKFVGGDTQWKLNDGGSDFTIGQGFVADDRLTFAFTYNGGSNYSYSFGSASGTNFTAINDISNINGVRFFNGNQGSSENLGFNNLQVVPEPSTYALLALGGAGLAGYIARRRSRK